MINALKWLNDNGGSQNLEVGAPDTVLALLEKCHPLTDELRDYMQNFFPTTSLDLDLFRIFNADDLIEVVESIDENGFLLSQGFLPVGDYDEGLLLFNANDASIHITDVNDLDLSRVEFDELLEEYFWDGEPFDDVVEDYEMVFDNCSTSFSSVEEFDELLVSVLSGEADKVEIGL